jgi:glycosyltransferase involved in cell wall biosynthesis
VRLIALLTDGFGGRGGIAKFNRDFLTALCALPAVDRIDCVYRHAPESNGNSPANLHTLWGATRGKIFFAVYAIFLAIRPQRVAMVVCGHLNLLVLAWAIAKIRRAKLLCVLHGVEGWQPNGNRLVNWLVRHADVYVVVSVLTQRRFQAWSGVSADRFALLPNCFESGVFAPGLKDPALLARYGVSADAQVLMTLGRLAGRERYKGFDEIIDLLPDLHPEIVYMIVGDGDDRQRLESKARELGVSERVVFTGYVGDAEKAAHYRLADAFLLAGRGEGFGIVLLEAMACAIPCIGSALDGTAEALREGQLGLVIDPTNRKALRDAIEASLRKPKLVPPGLEYFSSEQFHARARAVLSQILADEIAA